MAKHMRDIHTHTHTPTRSHAHTHTHTHTYTHTHTHIHTHTHTSTFVVASSAVQKTLIVVFRPGSVPSSSVFFHEIDAIVSRILLTSDILVIDCW